jgi:hypothetical protein
VGASTGEAAAPTVTTQATSSARATARVIAKAKAQLLMSLVAALIAAVATTSAAAQTLTVTTTSGVVNGRVGVLGGGVFLGIPFAEPPVGRLSTCVCVPMATLVTSLCVSWDDHPHGRRVRHTTWPPPCRLVCAHLSCLPVACTRCSPRALPYRVANRMAGPSARGPVARRAERHQPRSRVHAVLRGSPGPGGRHERGLPSPECVHAEHSGWPVASPGVDSWCGSGPARKKT